MLWKPSRRFAMILSPVPRSHTRPWDTISWNALRRNQELVMSGSSPSLRGRVALVTGCGPNINGGIAYGLADEGVKLICVDIRPDYAEGCASGIRQRGGEAVAAVADVSADVEVRRALAQGVEAFGPVDILVNGAVLQIRKGVLELSAEEFRRQLDASLVGALNFTKHVARAMIANQRRGSVINIISTEGHQGNPGNVGYGTAKGGLLNFTRS